MSKSISRRFCSCVLTVAVILCKEMSVVYFYDNYVVLYIKIEFKKCSYYNTLTAIIVPLCLCRILSTIPYAPRPRTQRVSKSSASTTNVFSSIVIVVRLSKFLGGVLKKQVHKNMNREYIMCIKCECYFSYIIHIFLTFKDKCYKTITKGV